jgi:hypothetical protein
MTTQDEQTTLTAQEMPPAADPQGCVHREHKGAPTCNKLCSPGHRMCPHHELLTEAQADQKEQRERERQAEAGRAKVRSRRR